MSAVLVKKFDILKTLHKPRIISLNEEIMWSLHEMNQNGKLVYLSYTTELNICIAPVLYFSVIFFLCNFHNHTQDITRKGYEEVLSQNIMEKKINKSECGSNYVYSNDSFQKKNVIINLLLHKRK